MFELLVIFGVVPTFLKDLIPYLQGWELLSWDSTGRAADLANSPESMRGLCAPRAVSRALRVACDRFTEQVLDITFENFANMCLSLTERLRFSFHDLLSHRDRQCYALAPGQGQIQACRMRGWSELDICSYFYRHLISVPPCWHPSWIGRHCRNTHLWGPLMRFHNTLNLWVRLPPRFQPTLPYNEGGPHNLWAYQWDSRRGIIFIRDPVQQQEDLPRQRMLAELASQRRN